MSSSNAVYIDVEIFDGGPPLRLQRSLGLVKPGQLHVVRRACLAALIAWLPLAILAAVQTIFFSKPTLETFFADLAVHARYLIAVPALILAEGDCLPRFEAVVRQFVDSGLVGTSDRDRYQHAMTSSRRLLDSTYSDVITWLLTYACVFALVFYLSPEFVPEWQQGNMGQFSLLGWWHMLVSVPVLLILIFGWLWRLALWGRFLVLMASLDLQLLPSHPDHVGGLKFVSTSLRGFRVISLALAAIVAGSIANRVVYHGADLLSYKNLAIGLLVSIVLFSAGPLTVFVKRLRDAKKRGVFAYGALANHVGKEFESTWLPAADHDKQDLLDTPQFSATTDLYAVVANVYEMRDVPFNMKDLIGPIIPALIPFGLVALLTIPFQVVIDTVIKLLL